MLIRYLKPDFVNEDDRGTLYQLVSKGYNQVNFIFSKANTVRGGHFHKINNEAFFVISGSFKIILEDGICREEYLISAGDFFEIGKNIKHTFEYLQDTEIISLYDNGVELENNEKDIYR